MPDPTFLAGRYPYPGSSTLFPSVPPKGAPAAAAPPLVVPGAAAPFDFQQLLSTAGPREMGGPARGATGSVQAGLPLTTAQQQVVAGNNPAAIPATSATSFAPSQVASDYRSGALTLPASSRAAAPASRPALAALRPSGSAPASPPIPATAAPAPAPSLFGQAASTVGQSLKSNPMDWLNGALGLAGAVEYATAQAPALPGKPEAYRPVIRPAQGLNVTALEAGRRGIQAAQTQAGRATGADTGTTAITRLLAQQQAGEQQAGLSIKDNEAFQQDQRRVDEQTNAAYDANYKTQRSYQEQLYGLRQRQYEGRRQQGAAMSQSALTYLTQASASKQQQTQATLEGQNRQTESQLQQYRSLPWATMSAADRSKSLAELDTLDPSGQARKLIERSYPGAPALTTSKARGGQLPSFGRGGKLRAGAGSRAIRPLPSSVESHHQLTREFGDQMQRITSQAMQAFHASLRQASAQRAKGLR